MTHDILKKAKAIKANMNLNTLDDINLQLTEKHDKEIASNIEDLFDMLKSKDTGKVDVTYLKAYMSHQNVQVHNPTFFKKVNDRASQSKFEGELSKKEFVDLFTNSNVFDFSDEPPSLLEITEMFEFLDEGHTGMISAQNLLDLLETTQRLKDANFDHQKYYKSTQITSDQLKQTLFLMKQQVDDLISSFDLTGDKLLSPEEFFNIIMYLYE